MAIKAQRRVEPWWFTPEDQVSETQPARFKCRALTSAEQTDIMVTYAEGKPNTRTWCACFASGVMEIENVTDGKDKRVRIARQFLSLPDQMEVIIEVGAEIFDKSFLSEDEKKTLLSE